LFRVDKIGKEKYFSYTHKEIDSTYHKKISLRKELEKGEIYSVDSISITKDGGMICFGWYDTDGLTETLDKFIERLKRDYGNYTIVKLEHKNLKINNIWSKKLWEEKKEVKMEQVQ